MMDLESEKGTARFLLPKVAGIHSFSHAVQQLHDIVEWDHVEG